MLKQSDLVNIMTHVNMTSSVTVFVVVRVMLLLEWSQRFLDLLGHSPLDLFRLRLAAAVRLREPMDGLPRGADTVDDALL